MKSFIHSKKFIYLLLTLIIFAGIVRFSYGFFVEKKGTHSDEEWSFGLANSYYEPYIYSSDDDFHAKNRDNWLSGKVLKNYLTVQKGERFSFGSVYYNMACDLHPPLYFFALHFLSSFFVDQYIPALGFIINIICFIIMSIFLYKLLSIITKSEYISLLGILFNTFNVGTLSMIIFIRMYTMATMFAVILAYYNAKLYYDASSRKSLSTYIKLAVFTCLGALTHHFFLPYAFMITAIMCIFWLIKKEWHTLGKYASYMLLGVALSIVIFPATLDHMFGIQTFKFRDEGNYTSATLAQEDTDNNQGSHLSTNIEQSYKLFTTDNIENYDCIIFKYYFCTCIYLIFNAIFGFSIISAYSKGNLLYVPILLLILFILALSIGFLFRKEPFFIKTKNMVINKLKKFHNNNLINKLNWFLISLFFTCIFIIGICSYRVNIILMGDYSTRYLFIIYPIVVILFVYLINTICKWIIHNKRIKASIFSILICSVLLLNIVTQTKDCAYFFNGTTYNTTQVKEMANDANIIIISPVLWHLTIYSPLIYDCNSFIYLSNASYFNQSNLFETIDRSKKTYIFIDTQQLIDENANNASSSLVSEASVFNYNEINTGTIIKNKQLRNLQDTTFLYLSNYLDHLSSEKYFQNYYYITNAVDFGAQINIYEITFKK